MSTASCLTSVHSFSDVEDEAGLVWRKFTGTVVVTREGEDKDADALIDAWRTKLEACDGMPNIATVVVEEMCADRSEEPYYGFIVKLRPAFRACQQWLDFFDGVMGDIQDPFSAGDNDLMEKEQPERVMELVGFACLADRQQVLFNMAGHPWVEVIGLVQVLVSETDDGPCDPPDVEAPPMLPPDEGMFTHG